AMGAPAARAAARDRTVRRCQCKAGGRGDPWTVPRARRRCGAEVDRVKGGSISVRSRPRARRAPVLGLLAASLLLLGGCGTLLELGQPAHARGRRVFGGVRRDLAAMAALGDGGISSFLYLADHPFLLLVAPFDLPLSL